MGATPSGTNMRISQNFPLLSLTAFLLAVTAMVSPARAQQRLDGDYHSVRIQFQGQTAPCQSPPLALNRDRSYEIWGEHRTYEVVQGPWLLLSHPKRRGLGHFVAQEIVFEYPVDARVC